MFVAELSAGMYFWGGGALFLSVFLTFSGKIFSQLYLPVKFFSQLFFQQKF